MRLLPMRNTCKRLKIARSDKEVILHATRRNLFHLFVLAKQFANLCKLTRNALSHFILFTKSVNCNPIGSVEDLLGFLIILGMRKTIAFAFQAPQQLTIFVSIQFFAY